MSKKRFYLFLFLLAVIFITIAVWIGKIVKNEMPFVDQWTRSFVDRLADTPLFAIARWLTNLGSEFFLIPFTISIAILLWIVFRDYLPALIFAGGTLFTHLLNMFIKELVERERPSISVGANAEGFSFPSGHAMISLVCYGLLAYFIMKKLTSRKAILSTQIFFAGLIFLIGISRYVINVHYLTDIIAGFVSGFLLLVGFIYLYGHIQKRRSRKYT